MATIGDAANAVDQALRDAGKPWHVLFDWAEARTGIDRLRLFVCLVCVAALYVSDNGRGPMLFSDLVGFAYPAYCTVALTVRGDGSPPPRPGVVAAPVKWLTYWLTFATVLVAERPFGALLRLVPLYCLVRTVFLVWCSAPVDANGSAYVYAMVVRRLISLSSSAVADNDNDDDNDDDDDAPIPGNH